MTEDKEKRPPTQSKNSKMRSGAIPQASASAGSAVAAAKRVRQSTPEALTHARARSALCIVSMVVKVFEETMTRVREASSPRIASSKSAASIFETNRTTGPL